MYVDMGGEIYVEITIVVRFRHAVFAPRNVPRNLPPPPFIRPGRAMGSAPPIGEGAIGRGCSDSDNQLGRVGGWGMMRHAVRDRTGPAAPGIAK